MSTSPLQPLSQAALVQGRAVLAGTGKPTPAAVLAASQAQPAGALHPAAALASSLTPTTQMTRTGTTPMASTRTIRTATAATAMAVQAAPAQGTDSELLGQLTRRHSCERGRSAAAKQWRWTCQRSWRALLWQDLPWCRACGHEARLWMR